MGTVLDKIEVVAGKENLIDTIAVSEIDSVFIHFPTDFKCDVNTLSKKLLEMGKTVHLNIDDFETKLGERRLDFLGKYAVVTLKNHSFRIRDIFLKRLFDLIISLLGIILLIPVSIIICFIELISCDKGPLIIPVVRVGKMEEGSIITNLEQCMLIQEIDMTDGLWMVNVEMIQDIQELER